MPQLLSQRLEVAVGIPVQLAVAESSAVDERSVIEAVEEQMVTV
jgi:hypothetical protein